LAGVIVLDASVLIAYLDQDDAHYAPAVWLLADAATNGEDLAMSPITLAEVLVGPVRKEK
jgi:predicted nucleic acid-binding protein